MSSLKVQSDGSNKLGRYNYRGNGPFFTDLYTTPSKDNSPNHFPVIKLYFLITSSALIPYTGLLRSNDITLSTALGVI